MTARLFIFDGVLAYTGVVSDADEHSHHALQLTVAIDGGLEVFTPGGPSAVRAQALLVPPDEPHQLRCKTDVAVFVFVDPEMFEATFAERPSTINTSDGLGVFHDPARQLVAARTATTAREILKRVVNALPWITGLALRHRLTGRGSTSSSPLDPRVVRTCRRITQTLPDQVSVEALARLEDLSASRLAHLFSGQIGIPIKRYALWRRIHMAARASHAGATITEVAHAAGFSDLAHLSRTVHAMFGLPPSAFANDSEFIQGGSLWEK